MEKNDSKNQRPALGALLVDLENLYQAVRDEFAEPADRTVRILQNLRKYLKEDLQISVVVGRAYAPLDYSTSREFINDLALMGITPVHVLAKPTKNSADLMLSIDCMEFLFKREDIEVFVIVGGDRDYIPVVDRIQETARRALLVCPRHSMSGDLLTIIGEQNYLDAISLLPPELRIPASWEKVVEDVKRARNGGALDRQEPGKTVAAEPASAEANLAKKVIPNVDNRRVVPHTSPKTPSTMADLERIVNDSYELEELKACMKLLLEFQNRRNVREIWIGPVLRTMNDAFPLKNNEERKALLDKLRNVGAIEIVERPRHQEGGTYAAALINWKHPLALEMNPG